MNGYDTYDYGARGYYPAMGRFTSVDPLCEKHYNISPYAYCVGNPVNLIDPDGMDWFQNSQTGAVEYVSDLHKGAEKGMEKGWQWMGENDMFKSDKDDIANSDQTLAAKNGGDFQKNGSVSMSLNGDDAKKFMGKQGYDFKPTQQIRDELEFDVNIDHDKFPLSTINGEQTFITEKSAYVLRGSIEDGIIPTKPNNLLYLGNHTVNRFQITYTTNFVKKALNSLMHLIGYHDFRIPTVYSSPSEYPRNNKYIDIFLRTRK